MPRKEFSVAVRRAAWERAGGRCEGTLIHWDNGTSERCGAPIDIGNFHYDHIVPTWMSDDASLANCQVLCTACHKTKTKQDVKNIAKVKRIQKKQAGLRKPRGRALAGTKRSGWKRKIDGRVERR